MFNIVSNSKSHLLILASFMWNIIFYNSKRNLNQFSYCQNDLISILEIATLLKGLNIQIDERARQSQHQNNVFHLSQTTSTGKSWTSLKHGWFHGLHSQALLQHVHSLDAIMNCTQRESPSLFYTRRDNVHIIPKLIYLQLTSYKWLPLTRVNPT